MFLFTMVSSLQKLNVKNISYTLRQSYRFLNYRLLDASHVKFLQSSKFFKIYGLKNAGNGRITLPSWKKTYAPLLINVD